MKEGIFSRDLALTLSVSGKIIILDGKSKNINLKNKIAVIENADPGFDWIFTRPIAGLVTCWGGANSHMAIRCHEMGIPAAIGVGPSVFKGIAEARLALLDCSAKRLEVIN